MNNYKPLIWAGSMTLVILSIFLLASTNHVVNSSATTNTVSFSGQGKVVAKPDVAVISLSIVTEAATSKVAQDDNSKKSNTLVDLLKKQGVDEKDVKTTGYNIYPQYSYTPSQKPIITGYQVNQSLEVKVRDLEKVDSVLDGVVAAGVNQVNNLQLTVDKPEKLRAQAREDAIKDAKKKAEELEDQLGVDLGRIINFAENTGGYPIPMYLEAKDMASRPQGGGGGPAIPVGENEIVVDVSLTYQIK